MTHPYDDIEAFALGGLDDADAKNLHEHAEQCPTCAILLADAMQTMHAALGDVPNEPAAHATLRAPRRAFRLNSRVLDLAALAACVALLVWTALWRAQAAVTADLPVAALVHSHFVHHALHGPSGSAKALVAANGAWILVVADGLQPQNTYRATARVAGQTVALGSFVADRQGVATAFWRRQPSAVTAVSLSPSIEGRTASGELRWP